MEKQNIQRVIDLTSLLGRRDYPAIHTAITNPRVTTPFLSRLSIVLAQTYRPEWQLKDLKEQTLRAADGELKHLQDVLFDNKIWFKVIERSAPYLQAKALGDFYRQSKNSR